MLARRPSIGPAKSEWSIYRPGRPGRLSALSVFPSESILYGAFVWARRALYSQKRRFWARAVDKKRKPGQAVNHDEEATVKVAASARRPS